MAFNSSSDMVPCSRCRYAVVLASAVASSAVYPGCGEKGILAKTAMVGAARPRVAVGIICHSRADGVEFDIAVTVQDVTFAVDEAGFVAAFPQCSGTTVASIELTDVAASELLHKASNGSNFRRRGK